ncbi:hypothetical protein C5F50_09450 [Nitrosopumilus ureiphilus]|uniref:Uncharacterized protein n=1 Tax=Nitrosopumilus ureiphilus TaxID=1470067 RepID=A0A7D5R7N0_9ARCH|nr:hypothetical protein C5F50_09450 [Nitrosopumilus ureiphilus]
MQFVLKLCVSYIRLLEKNLVILIQHKRSRSPFVTKCFFLFINIIGNFLTDTINFQGIYRIVYFNNQKLWIDLLLESRNDLRQKFSIKKRHSAVSI